MGVMSPTMLLAKGADPRQINEVINADPRWELARKLGMTKMELRVDPMTPGRGQIQTEWAKAEGAFKFLAKVDNPFTFKDGSKTLARASGKPSVIVNPKRFNQLSKKLSTS